VGGEDDGIERGDALVARELLAAIVLFRRVGGDLDDKTGIDQGILVLRIRLVGAAHDGDVGIRRQ
jgi:hypothetical protein